MSIYGHRFDKLIVSQLENKNISILEDGSPGHPNGDSRMESDDVARKNDKLEAEKAEEAQKKREAEEVERYRKENNMETVAQRQARLNKEESVRQAAEKIKGKENWRIE